MNRKEKIRSFMKFAQRTRPPPIYPDFSKSNIFVNFNPNLMKFYTPFNIYIQKIIVKFDDSRPKDTPTAHISFLVKIAYFLKF